MDTQNDAIIWKRDTCSKAHHSGWYLFKMSKVYINHLHKIAVIFRVRMLQSQTKNSSHPANFIFTHLWEREGKKIRQTFSNWSHRRGTSPKPGLPSYLEDFSVGKCPWESKGPTIPPECQNPPRGNSWGPLLREYYLPLFRNSSYALSGQTKRNSQQKTASIVS